MSLGAGDQWYRPVDYRNSLTSSQSCGKRVVGDTFNLGTSELNRGLEIRTTYPICELGVTDDLV